jgi:ABC-type Zn uptake system ZnuABC Zn-binding protein ZnuA
MRRLLVSLGLILGLYAPAIADQHKIAIASIFPVADLLQQIGGDRWETLTLLPAGASVHTYEPTPEQVRQLAEASVFFQIGLRLEFWAEKVVHAAKNPGLVSVDLSEDIETIPTPSPELLPRPQQAPRHTHASRQGQPATARAHDHGHGGPDAHYWLDPIRMLQVVGRIQHVLTALDPESASLYAEGAQRVRKQLEELHAEIMQRTEGLPNRRFIALHAAWTYFAPRYNLEQAAVVEPFPGREPSPRYVVELAQLMRREQVQAVVLEPQLNTTAAKALARETGARVGLMDPYGGPGVPGRESYIELMRFNVAALVKLLQ